MDRDAWLAIVCGVTGVRHNLVTKPPPPPSPSYNGIIQYLSFHDWFISLSVMSSHFVYPFIQ